MQLATAKAQVLNLNKHSLRDLELQSVGISLVHGSGEKIHFNESTKRDVLGRFSPISKSYVLFNKSEITVLIGIDPISTGQNIQDTSNIMTVGFPYDPM